MHLRQILRRLVRAPGFTLVTALTLGLGIGADSAIFTVIESVLLKPLPYQDSERLIAVNHTAPGINFTDAGSAPFFYFSQRDENRTLEASGIWRTRVASITGVADPEEVRSIDMTWDVLRALGVPPTLGRTFSEADDSPGAPETVVLDYGYWSGRFGGDANVVGRRILIDGIAREIIGVMPRTFRFLNEHPSILRPLQLDRSRTLLGDFSYRGIGRLRTGSTVSEARADVARMIPIAIERFPIAPGYNKQMYYTARFVPDVKPLKDEVVGNIGQTLWVLLGTVGLVLLIACANVANLLLVRAEGRQQEFAVRAALGASGARIAGELLGESLVLGVAGGFLGLGFAYGGLRVLVATAPATFPRLAEISIDPAVLGFTLLVSLLAGLLFGAIPAIRFRSARLAVSIRSGGRALSASRERQIARDSLAIAQIALALVMLVGAGLMIRTFSQLKRVDPGFTRPSEVQTIHLYIPETQAKDGDSVLRMQQGIFENITLVPGVSSAGIVNVIPMTTRGALDPVWSQDQPEEAKRVPKLRRYRFVSPGYFQTMGMSLVIGREFTWVETRDRRPVAIVSENLARELWGNPGNAIGKQIHENPATAWREVIGVVRDEHEDGVDRDPPQTAYWPLLMSDFRRTHDLPQRSVTYVIRSTRTGTEGFVRNIERAVWRVNSNLPVAEVQTLGDVYTRSLARTSFTLVMLATAGGMALLIGLVGIYGVVSYSVSQRRREIGIRLALGAPTAGVMGMFVGHALLLGLIGTACGIVAALGMSRLMSSLLFQVSAADPMTYVVVLVTLLLVTAIASFIPARRATIVNPIGTLRSE